MLNRREKKMLKDLLKIIEDYRLDKDDLAAAAGFRNGSLISDWARRGSADAANVVALRDALSTVGDRLEKATLDELEELPLRKTYLAARLDISQSNLCPNGRKRLSPTTQAHLRTVVRSIGSEILARLPARAVA